MASGALHKAGELAPEIRRAVEILLGRRLEAEEQVSVTTYSPHKAPRGGARARLARRLERRINQTAKKAERVPEQELDALIDEAVDQVRHGRS